MFDSRMSMDLGVFTIDYLYGDGINMSSRVGHVAFDLDGCLWDSDKSHFDAVNIALAPYGERISEEEHQTIFKGLPTRRKLEMLTEQGRITHSDHADIERRKREATLQVIELVSVRYEVISLLLALRYAGWSMCCCSNSIRSTVQAVLLKMKIMDFMDFVLSNEDVDEAKPSPQIYEKAARIWQIDPRQMIVVEDGEAGRQAARLAGCRLIAISGPEEVEPWLSHHILATGRELIRKYPCTLTPVLAG